jgi:hypothetical protein
VRSTQSSCNATRPTRSQSSGTADGGRVPADGSGHAALLTLVRLLARQGRPGSQARRALPVSELQGTYVLDDRHHHMPAAEAKRRQDRAERQRLDQDRVPPDHPR